MKAEIIQNSRNTIWKAKGTLSVTADNNANDMEMDNLQDLYEQAVANGLLFGIIRRNITPKF